jgi:hypothetical protein
MHFVIEPTVTCFGVFKLLVIHHQTVQELEEGVMYNTSIKSSQSDAARTHTTGPEYAQTASTVEPLGVVLIKYESILPDDGSCVIRKMLE